MKTRIFLALSTLLVGCAAHVPLTAPGPGDPLKERVAAYAELAPVGIQETLWTRTRNGIVVSATPMTDYIQLTNGSRIYYPEDLLPIVSADSPTAKAAENSRTQRRVSSILSASGWGLLAAGVTTVIASIAGGHSSGGGSGPPAGVFVGMGIALVGSGAQFAAMPFARASNDEKTTSYSLYDAGLRSRLNLCPGTAGLADCASADAPAETR